MARADNLLNRVLTRYGMTRDNLTDYEPKSGIFLVKEARRLAAYLLVHDYNLEPSYVARKVGYRSRDSVYNVLDEVPDQLERPSNYGKVFGTGETIGDVLEDIRLGEDVDNLGQVDITPVAKRPLKGRTSLSGVRGVTYVHSRKKKPWKVCLCKDSQQIYVGTYATLDEACEAARRAGKEHGIPERRKEPRLRKVRCKVRQETRDGRRGSLAFIDDEVA